MILSNEVKAEQFKHDRKNPVFQAMIHKNALLVLEITEKQASRYLSQCKNSFKRMIEEKIIVANNKLQIEKLTDVIVTAQTGAMNSTWSRSLA